VSLVLSTVTVLEYTALLFASVKREMQQSNGSAPLPPKEPPPVSLSKEPIVAQTPAKPAEKPAEPASTDTNQHTGPRARFLGTPGRKPKQIAEGVLQTDEEDDADAEYRDMEDKLDDLIATAREVEDSDLVARLREVRRYVIVKGVDLAEGRSES
jgi:hypothetical protein